MSPSNVTCQRGSRTPHTQTDCSGLFSSPTCWCVPEEQPRPEGRLEKDTTTTPRMRWWRP